jgi:hypothetical protein
MNHRTMAASASHRLLASIKAASRTSSLCLRSRSADRAGDEWLAATPLFEARALDPTLGEAGRIDCRMELEQERQANNRGAALWGNLVISPAPWPPRNIATDQETITARY